MRYSHTINNIKAFEWGLNIQQAYLFAWFYELQSWSTTSVIDNEVYYLAPKSKAIKELPILSFSVETMDKFYKQLEELKLIKIKKIDTKDFVCLTEKGKDWNNSCSINCNENFDTLFAKNSIKINSENDSKQILFSDSIWNDYQTLKSKLATDEEFKKEFAFVDLRSYIEDCLAWSVSKNKKSTNNGWYLTLRKWMRDAKRENRLTLLKNVEIKKANNGFKNH